MRDLAHIIEAVKELPIYLKSGEINLDQMNELFQVLFKAKNEVVIYLQKIYHGINNVDNKRGWNPEDFGR